jgi:hypothetical protein
VKRVILAALFASCAAPVERAPVSEPQAGDRWTYQKLNAYNSNPKGEISYEALAVAADALKLEVAEAGRLATRTYPIRWSQFELVDGRQFVYPLQQREGRKESVIAFSPDTQQSIPVTVYSRVSGWEKVKVPAGEFDALKISRNIYVDDRDWYKNQTRVRQSEWYASSIAQPVKHESQASYWDLRRNRHGALIEGDWNRWVLTSHSTLAAREGTR